MIYSPTMRNAHLGLLLLSLMAARPLPAQSSFGSILGTVTDNSQAVVSRAAIRIRNTGTNAVRTVVTDQNGNYQRPPCLSVNTRSRAKPPASNVPWFPESIWPSNNARASTFNSISAR